MQNGKLQIRTQVCLFLVFWAASTSVRLWSNYHCGPWRSEYCDDGSGKKRKRWPNGLSFLLGFLHSIPPVSEIIPFVIVSRTASRFKWQLLYFQYLLHYLKSRGVVFFKIKECKTINILNYHLDFMYLCPGHRKLDRSSPSCFL